MNTDLSLFLHSFYFFFSTRLFVFSIDVAVDLHAGFQHVGNRTRNAARKDRCGPTSDFFLFKLTLRTTRFKYIIITPMIIAFE